MQAFSCFGKLFFISLCAEFPRPICFSILKCNSLIAPGTRWRSRRNGSRLMNSAVQSLEIVTLIQNDNRTDVFFVPVAIIQNGSHIKWLSYRMTIIQSFVQNSNSTEWQSYRMAIIQNGNCTHFLYKRQWFFVQKGNHREYQLYRLAFVQMEIGFCVKWKLCRRAVVQKGNHTELLNAELLCVTVRASPNLGRRATDRATD